ncbi:MAG: hypothetical protein AB7O50_11440 [Pseudolabrys sp.]
MTTSSNPSIRLFATEQRARLERAQHGIALVRYVILPALAVTPLLRFLRQSLRVWNARLKDRHFLAGLHEFQVHEMGLTLAERDHEAQKPFWQA